MPVEFVDKTRAGDLSSPALVLFQTEEKSLFMKNIAQTP